MGSPVLGEGRLSGYNVHCTVQEGARTADVPSELYKTRYILCSGAASFVPEKTMRKRLGKSKTIIKIHQRHQELWADVQETRWAAYATNLRGCRLRSGP